MTDADVQLYPGVIRDDTRIVIQEMKKISMATPTGIVRVGGLSNEIETITQSISAALYNADKFRAMGVPPPKGILLYGPPGTGKTLLARYMASRVTAAFFVIQSSELASKFVGESEERLREIFRQAELHKPSIVFIDEVEVIGSKRDDAMNTNETARRTLGTLLVLMDGLHAMDGVFVIAATNQPSSIDPALRRPGRFDRELEIGVPNVDGRHDILQVLLTNMQHELMPSDIMDIAKRCHGYVGADLVGLVREAAMLTMKSGRHAVIMTDMESALHLTRPSAMRELQIDVPHVRWSDIGGQDDMKRSIQEAVLWPLQKPEIFKRFGMAPPKGILLYGPPGCAKTLVAKAVATECGLNFLSVKGPELFSMWVGESERAVRDLFRKARVNAPSIIFFDEIDAIGAARGQQGSSVGDRVLSAMLTEMDGVEGLRDVVVIAATNRPDIIDQALLRPGRFDRLLYVPLPDKPGREEILRICLRGVPVSDDIDLFELGGLTEGYSGAELKSVCQEAAMIALRHDITITALSAAHLHSALQRVPPRTPAATIQFFDNFSRK